MWVTSVSNIIKHEYKCQKPLVQVLRPLDNGSKGLGLESLWHQKLGLYLNKMYHSYKKYIYHLV